MSAGLAKGSFVVSGLLACLWLAACESEQPQDAAPARVPAAEETSKSPAPEPAPAAEPAPLVTENGLILTQVAFTDLPGYAGDDLVEALPALKRSCARLLTLGEERSLGPDGQAGTVADWHQPCADLEALAAGDEGGLRRALAKWFTPFQVATPDSETGLFTGYYESELRGHWDPPGPEAVPLYRLPEDLVAVDLSSFDGELKGQRIQGRLEGGKLLPYFTRKEIDDGAIAGRGLELIWAEDEVDAFFLHVQGSGRVILPDGEVVRVGFAGSNGHPFTAIGRYLINQGIVSRENASMQAVRDWLRANPEAGREIMQKNARYIFFRQIEGEGPIGAQGVALTAGRSLAVDPAYIALGLPVFLDSTWPGKARPLRRLMVAQDKGAAIKGGIRGDVYWGSGEEALHYAGRMKQEGRLYIFLPKSVAERRITGS